MSLKYSLIFALCLTAIVSVTTSAAERAHYDNYRVYRVNASNEREVRFLKQMESSSDSLIFLEGIHLVNKSIEVVVAPHKLPDFLKALDENEIDYELLTENLQTHLNDDVETMAKTRIQGRATNYGWEAYYPLNDTYTWLIKLASEYPNYVTVIEAGKSYEKRSILGLKISNKNDKKKRPGIFWEGGIHAREWISPAVTTYFINQLLTSEDVAIKDLAQNYDWYIFPHTNPDGYVYTHTTNRLWRKTRQPHGTCYGADPNRNWDFHWNTVGASDSPCSDTYAGTWAFSEIETKSMSNYIQSLKGKIQLYLSFHSYSQYILYPFGYTNELPSNIDDFKEVFKVGVEAIGKRYGTKYSGGNTYDAIYPASGSSTDYVYGVTGIRMSFCVELRPGPKSRLTGFQLPAAQIIPTSEETVDGVIAVVNKVNELGYFKMNEN